MPRPSPLSVGDEAPHADAPAHCNVAVGSHGEYFPTLCLCVNAAVSKVAW